MEPRTHLEATGVPPTVRVRVRVRVRDSTHLEAPGVPPTVGREQAGRAVGLEMEEDHTLVEGRSAQGEVADIRERGGAQVTGDARRPPPRKVRGGEAVKGGAAPTREAQRVRTRVRALVEQRLRVRGGVGRLDHPALEATIPLEALGEAVRQREDRRRPGCGERQRGCSDREPALG